MVLTTNDPAKLALALFSKGDTTKPVFTGMMGNMEADITGLKASQVIAAGSYKASFTDGTNFGPKVDLDAMNVLPAEPDDNAAGTATVDTAKVGE